MRLIDADALMQDIKSNAYIIRDVFNSTDEGMSINGIQYAVDHAPTIVLPVAPTKPQKLNRPLTEILDEYGIEWEYSDDPEDAKRTLEVFDEAFFKAFGIRPPATPTVSEDCISRQQALEEIALHDCTNGEVPYFTGKGVQEILNTLPPLTPTERTGEWVKNDHRLLESQRECSLCGESTMVKPRYCPNCGAKMKGGTENE